MRSRLIRLIPSSSPTSPVEAIRTLLSHRFPSHFTEREARDEWHDVVEGRSKLWRGIPADRKETIRGFLVYFENELLRRAQKNFSFRNGSIGNYFLTAAHLFFRSVPSAIFLFSSITGSQVSGQGITCFEMLISDYSLPKAHILPVLVTNHTVTIAAELENGGRIVGQCEISHPVHGLTSSGPGGAVQIPEAHELGYDDQDEDEDIKQQTGNGNIMFAKADERSPAWLESKIQRVFYINQYGQEIFPSPNQEFIKSLASRDVLVYSIGSLWTSIIPCLALRGVASAIAKSPSLRAKVLLLNGYNDRETMGYDAVDYVNSITRTLNHYDLAGKTSSTKNVGDYPTSAFITHLVYLERTGIEVDELALRALGIEPVKVSRNVVGQKMTTEEFYQAIDVQTALARIVA
ncbi:hypothetical protein FRC03_001176 [Tulasnella sp. 419]|nr:hypothetical protein FRC03_001176 [Tulasnella sp. 419]